MLTTLQVVICDTTDPCSTLPVNFFYSSVGASASTASD